MGRKHESPALDTNVWAIPSSNCVIKLVLASSAQQRSRGSLATQLAFDGGTTLDFRHFVQFVMLGSIHLEQYAILLVRVFLGLFFAISGARKLFVADGAQTMYETLIAARVPLPRLMTYFVSAVEFVGGVLLVTGFFSTLACAALAIDMVVAIVTTKISVMPKELSAEPCGSSCDTLPASYSPRRAQQRNSTLVAGANTKVSPIPLSNCFASSLPA